MVGVPPELWEEYADDYAEDAHYPHPHDYDVDGLSESDETEDGPDPTHECVSCQTQVTIESEPRTRTTHWCDSCESLKPHQKL